MLKQYGKGKLFHGSIFVGKSDNYFAVLQQFLDL